MESVKRKWKKYLTFRGLVRSRSAVHGSNNQFKPNADPNSMKTKSKSWNSSAKYKPPVAPDGCFHVYVGPEKQRFVVKTEFANHPLFQMLLEDAELEYGYNSQGPILLPCDVELFYHVLEEVDSGDELGHHCRSSEGGYGAALIACSPLRLTSCASRPGYGGYRLLSPSPMLKLNGI